MGNSISMRLMRLERAAGANDPDRWLRSLSDEELEMRIAELDAKLRSCLTAEGIDCTGLTGTELCAVLDDLEARDAYSEAAPGMRAQET